VVWALSQHDAKRLLAYHSISQMGYVLAAFGAVDVLSTPAASAYAVNHALFKSLLFLTVGTFIRISGERSVYEMRGLGRRAPLLAAAFLVGALSIAGIPPFNGYAGKQFVSAAVYGSPVYLMLWATAVGTTASFIKLSRVLQRGPERPERVRTGPVIGLPVWLLAAASLATGLFGRPLFAFYRRMLGVTGGTAIDGAAVEGATGSAAAVPELFTPTKLLDSALILGLGIVLYLLISTRVGKTITGRIGSVAPDITTVLIFFFVGLAVFSGFALAG
jgi:multicomponent Na+:H+ antiporter subunit D